MSLSPLVCAHRGRSGIFPENTLPAYEAAIELGADFIELDVRRTADGEIICLHDPTVDRTTDGAGELSSLTLAQVQALDAGSWKGAEHAGARIPLLREVLEQIAPHMVIHIEIKQRGIAEQVVEIVRETGALRRVAIISFDFDDLRTAKAAEPAAACGLITSKPKEEGPEGELALIASALECGANFISCGHRAITPTLVRECHLVGLSLIAWTMDTPEDLRPMVDLGVDMLCSNFPERALEVLGR
mgnify:FL=1|jgi:glycerophosphoryl diester phosphodiesterase